MAKAKQDANRMPPDYATLARRDEIVASLGALDSDVLALVTPVATEVAWMEGRLAATRDLIRGTQAVVPYDNGGGQRGIRKNPAYDAYHDLFKSYTLGLRSLRELSGKKVVAKAETPGKLIEMRKESPLFKAV